MQTWIFENYLVTFYTTIRFSRKAWNLLLLCHESISRTVNFANDNISLEWEGA